MPSISGASYFERPLADSPFGLVDDDREALADLGLLLDAREIFCWRCMKRCQRASFISSRHLRQAEVVGAARP